MSPASPDPALGAYLKALRLNAGLDVAVLARRLSLSPAQLMQLESGQGSLFYNHRIRQQAARKVILHLGGDLSLLDEKPPELPDATEEPAPATPAPALAPQAQPAAAPAPLEASAARQGQRSPAQALLVLLVLTVASVAGWQMLPAREAATAQASAVPAAPMPPAAAPVAPAEPAPVAVAMLADTAKAEAPVPDLPAPAQERAAAGPASASETCPGTAAAPSVQPPEARKAGDMVYVVSTGDVWVCLSDGSGRLHRKRLLAGQSQSFYGSPPWVVGSDQLRQTQLYFQGWKVRLPEQARDSIKLVELR